MRYINFDNIQENREWAFESVRSTEQWTHGYHRYPAKFLPDVVRKIWTDYTQRGIYRIQIWYILMFQQWYEDEFMPRLS